MNNIRLLIIDDDLAFYGVFRRLHVAHYAFEVAADVERGLGLIKPDLFDAVLLDLEFTGKHTYDEGLYQLLPKAVVLSQGTFPIIVATSDNRKETAQRAEKNGAAHLLRKSEYDALKWDEEIRRTIRDFNTAKTLAPSTPTAEDPEDGFLAISPQMIEIKKRLRKHAEYLEYSILLLGEPGVGKEVAAAYLHGCKKNPQLPFVAVNLSALGEKIIEGEIFGHVKGAFTDAHNDKVGYFEQSRNGTLFLDEIGEVSLEIQATLLRVFEKKEFSKVGSTKKINLDAHLVFATNRNLEQAVADGLFREDFYSRIKKHVIHIPPLRERKEEILPLMTFFWDAQLKRKSSHPMYGKKITSCFTKEALKKLMNYAWPGNIRELKSTVEELIFESDFQEKNIIDLDLLPDRFRVALPTPAAINNNIGSNATSSITAPHTAPDIHWTIAKRTAYQELTQIEKALIAANGRKDDVARMLGLKDDNALRYKVKTKYHNIFPELFDDFPVIKKLYKF